MNKYRNKPTTVNGIRFDSKRESERYRDLMLLERAGEIRDLKLQPVFPIAIGGVEVKYPSGRRVKYIADFMYFDEGTQEVIIEDVKGVRTTSYLLKKALMHTMGYEIVEIS